MLLVFEWKKFRGFPLSPFWQENLPGFCIVPGLLRRNPDRSLDQVVDGLEASLEQQQNLPGLPLEGPGGLGSGIR